MKYSKGILTITVRQLRYIWCVIVMYFCVYSIWFPSKINIIGLALLELYIVSTALQNWWDERQEKQYELELMKMQIERGKND